jgi:hypothetical protein
MDSTAQSLSAGRSKPPQLHVSQAMALPRRQLLFDSDPEYLSIIRDYWHEHPHLLSTANMTLQSIEHVLESVVDVMHEETAGAHVQHNVNFQ